MAGQWKDERPMAPHLQVWKWHPAMLSSILHRISCFISYAFLLKIAVALLMLKLNGKIPLEGLVFSPLGYIGFFVGFFAFIFLAFAQLRHLIWDQGKYLEPGPNNMLSWVMIFGALALSAIATFMAFGG